MRDVGADSLSSLSAMANGRLGQVFPCTVHFGTITSTNLVHYWMRDRHIETEKNILVNTDLPS